jgi:hypothetical protein
MMPENSIDNLEGSCSIQLSYGCQLGDYGSQQGYASKAMALILRQMPAARATDFLFHFMHVRCKF